MHVLTYHGLRVSLEPLCFIRTVDSYYTDIHATFKSVINVVIHYARKQVLAISLEMSN